VLVLFNLDFQLLRTQRLAGKASSVAGGEELKRKWAVFLI